MPTVTIDAESPAMRNMLREAARVGIPKDQAREFVTRGYIPFPIMMPFHRDARLADERDGPDYIALGGSRGPGKSYAVLAQAALDDCQRIPSLKVLFLRKMMKTAAESLDDLVSKVLMYTPHKKTATGVKFQNGSVIVIGGYKDARDIDKYLGLEYDLIIIEEVTQFSEERIEKIRGSLRSTKPGWRPRIYMSTNADGIGLVWFKKRFIIPWRNKNEQYTRFHQVDYTGNPFLDESYVRWLRGLKGPLGKAWRDSDWDAFAGMAFPMWNYERHVIEPFDIPDDWPKWRAIDYGKAAPFCCLWLTRDPDRRKIYVYREAYKAELTTTQQCNMIHDMSPENEKYLFTFADPAMWARSDHKGETYSIAQDYQDNGILLTKGNNDRLGGKAIVDTMLSDGLDGLPGMMIFDTCTALPEQLAYLARDERNPEDVDTDMEDHAFDTLKYGFSNVKRVKRKPPTSDRNPLEGVKGL